MFVIFKRVEHQFTSTHSENVAALVYQKKLQPSVFLHAAAEGSES